MNIEYSEGAKQWGESYALVQQATESLKEVLGPIHQDVVRGNWARIEDERHRTLYRLTLSDFAGTADLSFEPDELRQPTHMLGRLYHLLGKLLQVRSAQQLKELRRLRDLED